MPQGTHIVQLNPHPRFHGALPALGTGLWNGMFIGLGWALGAQWQLAQRYLHMFEYGVLAVAIGVLLWFLWRRRRAHEGAASIVRRL